MNTLSKLLTLAQGLNIDVATCTDGKFLLTSTDTLATIKIGSFNECVDTLDHARTVTISTMDQIKRDYIASELKHTGHNARFTKYGVTITHDFYKKVSTRTLRTVAEFAEYMGEFVSEIQVSVVTAPA